MIARLRAIECADAFNRYYTVADTVSNEVTTSGWRLLSRTYRRQCDPEL